MMAEMLAALLGAAVGAAATYLLDLRKADRERTRQLANEAIDRRHQRNTVATALLSDLQALEFRLRQLYHDPKPLNAAGERPNLFYDELAGDVRGFSAAHVHPIADFFRLSQEVFAVVRDLRTRPDRINDRLQHQTRSAAGFALQALVRAKDALVAEGGTIPGPVALAVVRAPNLPEIPSPVFPLSMLEPTEEIPHELR